MDLAKIQAALARHQKPTPSAIVAKRDGITSCYLYGDISDEMVSGIVTALSDPAGEVRLYVNSIGGSVFAAKTIMAAIGRKVSGGTPVIGIVDGIAASAASFLLMACSRVEMHPEAEMMAHLPHAMAAGSAADFRAMADLLEQETDSLVRIYCKKTGMDPAEMRAFLESETFMGAKEAVERGFADTIVGEKPAAPAATMSSKFLNVAVETQRLFLLVAQAMTDSASIARSGQPARSAGQPAQAPAVK